MRSSKAQTTVEFTFSFFLMLLLFYGCLLVFRWAGASMAERRIAHERILQQPVRDDWTGLAGPESQLDTDFYDISQSPDFVLKVK